jgi:hypothetical protein
LQQAVAHPRLGHRVAGILEDLHLAVRGDARREIDHEVRRACPRDPGRERVRRQPRLARARRRDALRGTGVVREQGTAAPRPQTRSA